MNKNLLIVGLISLLLIGLIILGVSLYKKNTPTKNPKQIELTYEINAGIPFMWDYEIKDESIVKFVKKYVIRDDNKGGITGASVYTNYVFEGLKEGTTTVTFKYKHIDGKETEIYEINKIKVDKNLNITLVSTDKNK